MEGIRKLPSASAGDRDRYPHPRIEGLWLRVTDKGAKSFYFEARLKGGKPVPYTIGSFPKCSLDLAEKEAKRLAGLLAQGIDPRAERRKTTEEPTIDELFKWFTQGGAKDVLRPATLRGYQQSFDKLVEAKLSTRKASEVTKADIRDLFDTLTKAGKKTTANRMLSLISSMYNAADAKDYFKGVNPAAGIKKNRETAREVRLYDEQIPVILKAIDSLTSDTMRDFFLLALLTGQRRGTVCAMRWDNLRLEERLWFIPDAVTKNKEPHRVTLPDLAVNILERRKESAGGSPFVFPSRSKSGHMVEPKKAWADVLKDAGFDKGSLRIHDLRHTIVTYMVEAVGNLPAVAKAIGHKDIKTTMKYTHFAITGQRDAHTRGVEAMLANAPDFQPRDPNTVIVKLSKRKSK
ncbi:Prophage CP4-57 integrase [compost metagenome]